jgi:iron complex outermembrane recepter protein
MKFERSKSTATVSAAVSSALLGASAGYAPHAWSEETLQEVVVTGIRAGLERAQDIKRDAVGIEDAIAAEDLGKFPDSNIAEALQRVPGVAIDRNGGEGQFVTIRGFGPAFNTVLLNGRPIESETGGREFSFDLYPSELIAGAEIFKTGTAHLDEGGIGATVNLKTARPLDLPDNKVLLSAQAHYEDASGKTTPQAFALFSRKFNDGKMGLLLSGSYQDRKSQNDFLTVEGWLPTPVSALSSLAPGNSNPGNVSTAFIPRDTESGRQIQERKRANFQTVFQADLSDTARLTVDGFYNDYKVYSNATMLESYQGTASGLSNVVLDPRGTVLSEDVMSEVGVLDRLEGRHDQTYAFGINLDMHPTDELQTIFDVSYSGSKAPQSTNNGQAVMGLNPGASTFTNSGQYSYLTYANAVNQQLLNTNQYFAHVAQYGDQTGDGTNGDSVTAHMYSTRFDGTYTPHDGGFLKNIRFGTEFTREEKTVDIVRPSSQVYCLFCGFNIPVPASLLQPYNTSGLLAGLPAGITRNMYTFSLPAYVAWQSSPAALALRDTFLGLAPGTSLAFLNSQPGGFIGTIQPDSYAVTENRVAAYAESTMAGNWGSTGWKLNVGERLVYTKTTALGNQQDLTGLSSTDPNTTEYFTTFNTSGSGFLTETNSYIKLLPDLNLTLNLTNQFLVRFGMSQTMARPQLTDLAPSLSYADPRPGALNATSGNANLKPYTSTNLDTSFEYYFGTLNYVTIAPFYKQVDDFIVTDAVQQTIPLNINIANDDPLINKAAGTATFTVQEPVNAKTATVRGLEIAGQYVFDFGLGASVNATFLSSNAEIQSNSGITTAFAIPGLSNTKNAQIFYDHGPFEARVTWNERDAFLLYLVNPKAGVEPVFTDKYQQVDFRVSYHVSDHWSVFADGTNVLNEAIGEHGRYTNQFILYRKIGPSYDLGVRASF